MHRFGSRFRTGSDTIKTGDLGSKVKVKKINDLDCVFSSFKFQILEVSCHSLTIIDLVGWQQNAYGPSEAEFKHKNREKK